MASIPVSKTVDLGSNPSFPAILPGSQAVRHMTLTHGCVGSNPTPAAILIFKERTRLRRMKQDGGTRVAPLIYIFDFFQNLLYNINVIKERVIRYEKYR